MEVDSKTVAACVGVTPVAVHKWRDKPGMGPEWTKRKSKYFYPLGSLIRWAIDRRLNPLIERIEASERTVQCLETRLAVAERKLSKRKTKGVTKAKLAMRRMDREAARLARLGTRKTEN